jgi:hypothetical protein
MGRSRSPKRVTVDVAPVTGTVALLPPLADRRNHILDSLRQDLMKQLDTARPRKRGAAPGPYSFAALYNASSDYRSAEEFRQEVEQYLNDFDQAMQQSLAHAVRALVEPLTLKLTNPGEENLTKGRSRAEPSGHRPGSPCGRR